jgi:hypothetical protein
MLKKKRIFLLPLMWFIYYLWEKNKSDMYIILQWFKTFFFYVVPITMILLELLAVWLVLV